MKYFKITLLSLFACTISSYTCQTNSEAASPEDYTAVQDSLLYHIESKLENAFIKSVSSNEHSYLDKMLAMLASGKTEQNKDLTTYWMALAYYKKAIVYINNRDKASSQKAIEEGVDMMEEKKQKNGEDYALLAYLQNFAIQFKSGFSAGIYSSKIKKNARKATAIDAENMRAYLVLGINDFYTPEKYGGGKKAEKYLLKALSLDNQKIANPYLPAWGKNEVYYILIRYYIRKEQYDLAKKYFKESIQLYPDDYQINQLAKKLVDK